MTTRQPLALIVGCGGLAIACARGLGQSHRLALVDRDQATLTRAAADLCAEGIEAFGFRCNVANPDDVAALASALPAFGKIRSIAHVVGLSPSGGDSRSILAVNAIGAARVAEAVLPLLDEQAAAVFISSLGGHIVPAAPPLLAILDDPLAPDFIEKMELAATDTLTPSTAYAWSKIALMRMCVRLAPRWGLVGARINSLSPGLIDSPMGLREFTHEPRKYALLDKIPLGRQGSMVEVADAVEYLCSSRASYISGTDLLIDGGVAAALRGAI
jgi:NAD(P)-dependent dehydrogenase (short-subunit alcohol dehydrogenase family)